MAAKRLLSESCTNQDEPKEKRMRPKPSFASVIGEAVMMNCLCTALEPVLRRVVKEEVERGVVVPRLRSFTKSPSLRIEAPSTLQLIFSKPLSLPIFTGSKIVDEDNNQLQVLLVDSRCDQRNIPVILPNTVKVDIVVLDGDFPMSGDGNNWTSEEFDKNIVRERTGKRPLLAGDLAVTVREGVASIGDIEFTDNSSWIRSRKFRIGAKIANGSYQGVRIKEAITQAFVVKDHRGELYKKHHPPMLQDDVWRLEKIGKDGAFHKKLASEGVKTVQDFLKMSVVDPAKLRRILGAGMSDKMWDVTIKHAKNCVMGNQQYVLRGSNYSIFLNPICQVMRAEFNGSSYSTQNLTYMNRGYLEDLVRQAYVNWQSLEEIEVAANEIALLTQGEHMVDQYPNHNQIALRSYQQNGYLIDGSAEGYMPEDIPIDHISNWQISTQNFMNVPINNGTRFNILESNSDDDLASPRSFITGG